jgi:soluble lytic murein transglycosylase
MSSMWRVAVILPVLLGAASSSSAQYQAATAYPATAAPSITSSISDWRTLRANSNYRFADYARFLNANPGWPDDAKMRRWAEKAMQPGENAGTVFAFYANAKPQSGNGWARLTDAYAASGRMTDALAAAREAWASPDLSSTDEQAIWGRYGGSFTAADHDRRVDALLFAKDPDDAARFYSLTRPSRRAAFAARIAMQRKAANADALYQAAMSQVTTDPGLMMDRARYLRAKGYDQAARDLAAREHHFAYPAADADRFYEMLLILASDAAQDRQWANTYNITRHLRDALPAGTDINTLPLDLRDTYTSLAWLGGTTALDRLNRPEGAVALFDAYGQGGKSLQVQTKGNYWAGRAALAGGHFQEANAYFQRAAAYPELFYGQLALERLGRSVTAPPQATTQYVTTAAQRSAFYNRRLVQAVRALQNSSTEQALFVKALAESLDTDADRNLAVELGQQLRRQDLAVWTARMARVKGSMFYVRQAYPTLPAAVSSNLWSLAHGISRQESSFDPYAVSHAGARGMMQLMTGTAREQAGKMHVSYDSYRLISDPSYNVMLGSAYFQRMLNIWDGNIPLAVASYNAGSGNVSKWVRQYGDPRGRVDVLKWIEAIPFTETRSYVQRVIENSVVYDSMRGGQSPQTAMHVSRYLGKNRPG